MTPPMESFPDEIRDLFTRAFIVGRYDAKLRPTAEEWDRALNSYKRQLKQCTANPLHFYYNKLSACPYCEADERYRRILLNSQAFRRANMASSRQLQFSTPVSGPPVSTPSTSPQPTPPRPHPRHITMFLSCLPEHWGNLSRMPSKGPGKQDFVKNS